MSKKDIAPIHIEWSPERVRAINSATGEIAEGATLSEIGSLLDKRRHALVGVGRSLTFLKAVRLPQAAPEDLRRIIEAQMIQLFPLPAPMLAFDFYQTDDQTSEGCMTLIAAMRADDLRRLQQELQQAGLSVTRILPVAFGTPVVASQVGQTDALVVEGSPAGYALDVVRSGSLRFSRVVPRNSDLLCEAQRTLAAANAGHLPLITTGGASLPEAIPGRATALEWLHEAPPFHFELAEDRVRVVKKRIAAKNRMALLMLLAAILLATLIGADRSDQMAVVQKGEATWARQLAKLRSVRSTETDKAQKYSTMQATLQRAFTPAQPLSDVVAVINDSLPPDTWLTGVSVERGKPVQIRGTAKTGDAVSQFVDALGSTSRFRDVKLVFANSARIETKQVVQFNVTAFAIGNLPMPEPVKVGPRGAKRATSSASSDATGGQ